MCGICGIVNPGGVQRQEIKAMLRAIAHRGPDDEGLFIDHRIGMGNRRLSIIDLSTGRQPIANEDETIWVVLNGEIYNYQQLRRELLSKGHQFRTQSDTEVLVHLYEELGERLVERLKGMFAFAVWDGRQQKLLLARDHLGQKPLFYSHEGDALLFASEIKGILAVSKKPRQVDLTAMHHYLSLRFIPPPQTMLDHVKKLPPAHLLTQQHGVTTISRYWDISFHDKLALTDQEFQDRLREQLVQAVSDHLVSDVPVGAFLSGGMDSSMIVALMAQNLDTNFKTFAIGVNEQSFNELPYARAVAERYQTDHVESCVESDLVKSLPDMIWHLDEPSDPIAACQFYAASLAAKHVKVVLGGDGGDELFAGFDRYVGVGYVNYYARIPGIIRRHLIARLLDQLPENFSYKSSSQKLRWLQQLALLPTTAERYAEATCFFRFNHRQKEALFGSEQWHQVGHLNSADVIVEQFNRAPADNSVDRMLYADYKTRLPEHSLMLTDRMTMAHGLELRSPFLDHELVELLAAFPIEQKIKRGELKHVLRKLGRDYLPDEIVNRDKQGFMFPVAHWFRNDLYPFIRDYLLNSQLVAQGMFRRQLVGQLVEEHRRSHTDHHVRLWMLLNLAIWHDIYISQKSRDTVRDEMMKYVSPIRRES